ncbi:endonuclease/exonuclease/phosphatase family protein [Ravibacter arvi]|uniref:Endonuclease/exonuclease/phosphatase family protein n=1 Tax=Ravibacter arvi TaxID=2051041 RepID=A0ABP8LZ66_9BACT
MIKIQPIKFSLLACLLAGVMTACSSVKRRPVNYLNVASYNLRYDTKNDGINAWSNRKDQVNALIRYHDFDLFGTQEGLRHQLDDITRMRDYRYTGSGRDDGKKAGEHSAIFYKRDRFRLLDEGDFWLRETPETPGKGWDATCCNRIVSWAKFKDLLTKKEFFFFNAHFDHQGVVARKESGKLIVSKIREIAGTTPVILTGDFNSTPETEQIHTIGQLLKDTRQVTQAPAYGPEGTFNSFDWDAPLDRRIDYVFVSDAFEVLRYAVLTDALHKRYPSDHQPVAVQLVFKK